MSGLYHIRIQAYELEEQVDGEYVFIVQLKHNRNVPTVLLNPMNTPMGISLHNNHRPGGGYMGMGGPMDAHNDRRDVQQQQKWRKKCSKSFFDQIWLQHKNKPLLWATVKIINRAFDCEDFVRYNRHTNQFEFKFEKTQNQNMTTMTKFVSLPRKDQSKDYAQRTLEGREWLEPEPPKPVEVKCINPEDIDCKHFDFRIKLTLLPSYSQYVLF